MSKTFLFFSAQYLPTAGGVERYTNCLARKLLSYGHRVIVATSSLKGLPTYETDPDGIEIIRFPSIPVMRGRFPILSPSIEFFRIAKALWDQHIDYCIINTYFYPLSIYGAWITHRKHIPTILINHGSAWLMTGNPILAFVGRVYEHISSGICAHYCKRFFGVSEAATDWMKTFSIPAEGVITNAIDPRDLTNLVYKDYNWRAALDIPGDSKTISFVGRLVPEKGIEQLMLAMTAIRKEHPNTYLLVAGSGPLLDKYSNNPPEGVILLGVQPYPKVLALLQQTDIFCLPSRSEGFACTVLEAAAMGCPIITTATGGSPQLLINRDHGILLPDMDPNSISNACIEALNDARWRANASVLTRNRLLDNYTWDVSIKQLLHAFSIDTTDN